MVGAIRLCVQLWRAAARKTVAFSAVFAATTVILLLPSAVQAAVTGQPAQVATQSTAPAPAAGQVQPRPFPTPKRTGQLVGKPNPAQMKAWHKTLLKAPPPKAGCYTAKFPDTGWKSIPCKTPPHKLYLPKRRGIPSTRFVGGGSGADFVTTWAGDTTESEGSFDNIANVTSECDV